MDKNLEIIEALRQKLERVKNKARARKTALKQIQTAYKIQSLELERFQKLYECTLRDYQELQLKVHNVNINVKKDNIENIEETNYLSFLFKVFVPAAAILFLIKWIFIK